MKRTLIGAILLAFALAAPAHAYLFHECCDYSYFCPGNWIDNHDLENTAGGCTNEASPDAAGFCRMGQHLAICSGDGDECFTRFGSVDCAGEHCQAWGRLYCPGQQTLYQSYALSCTGGTHGGPLATTGITTAHCNDDHGYGDHHVCVCNATGPAANCS